MKEHDLKTWPEWYEPSRSGAKPYEIRKNDRHFEVGDTLLLREYTPPRTGFPGFYTGRWMRRPITHILDGGKFGVERGFAILSLGPILEEQDQTT